MLCLALIKINVEPPVLHLSTQMFSTKIGLKSQSHPDELSANQICCEPQDRMAKRYLWHNLPSKVWKYVMLGPHSGLTVPFNCNLKWSMNSFLFCFAGYQEYLCRLMKSLCLADIYKAWKQKASNSKRVWKLSKGTSFAYNFLGPLSSPEWELFLYEELSFPHRGLLLYQQKH